MFFAPALRILLVVLSLAMPGHAFGMASAHAAQPLEMTPVAAHSHHPASAVHESSAVPHAPDCLLTMCCACLPISSPAGALQAAEMLLVVLPAILPQTLLFPHDPPPRLS